MSLMYQYSAALLLAAQAQRAEMEAASLVQAMSTMQGLLEQQTARGLATVGSLLQIANRLISPELLTSVEAPVAQARPLTDTLHFSKGTLRELNVACRCAMRSRTCSVSWQWNCVT